MVTIKVLVKPTEFRVDAVDSGLRYNKIYISASNYLLFTGKNFLYR